MPKIYRRREKSRRRRGFSLLELLVAMFVLAQVIAAVLILLDSTERLSRSQTHLSEMQQSSRIAQSQIIRKARMAGRGGLPRGNMPQGVALSVRNNVPAAENLVIGDSSTPILVANTDVLTVRGIFESPIWWIDPEVPAAFSVDDSDPSNITGQLIVTEGPVRFQELSNDLSLLEDIADDSLPVALLLISDISDLVWTVVEFDPGNSNLSSNPATVAFKVTGGSHTTQYQLLSGGFPASLDGVSLFGVLEEHQYYLRQDYEIPGDPNSRTAPKLSRAQFYPNTATPFRNADYLARDIADNIYDFQVALGIEIDGDAEILDSGDNNDEWLFNASNDNPADTKWVLGVPPATSTNLWYLRLSTLALTDRLERSYAASSVNTIEDHAIPAAFNQPPWNQYRRHLRQSLIDLRNL